MSNNNETAYLEEKINVLKNSVQQAELEFFNNQILVEEGSVATGDKRTDNTFQAQVANAASAMKMWQRKLDVRKPRLEAYEAELKAKQAKAAETKPVE